jgi:hypothetical protein
MPRKAGQPKPAHYRGSYHVASRRVREAAAASPYTTCWRCGRTLAQHPPHKTGKPARWTAGHLRDGDPSSPLLPEASTCNKSAGAAHGNRLRGARRAAQKAAGAMQRHTSVRW